MKMMEMDERTEVLLSLIGSEDIVLTKNGRAVVRVEPFTDEDLDDSLFEHDPATLARAEAAREQIRQDKGIPHTEVRRRLEELE